VVGFSVHRSSRAKPSPNGPETSDAKMRSYTHRSMITLPSGASYAFIGWNE
jgi:hypothetical protein